MNIKPYHYAAIGLVLFAAGAYNAGILKGRELQLDEPKAYDHCNFYTANGEKLIGPVRFSNQLPISVKCFYADGTRGY